eukprot:6981677-Pyramimonas_sp.AAC.1
MREPIANPEEENPEAGAAGGGQARGRPHGGEASGGFHPGGPLRARHLARGAPLADGARPLRPLDLPPACRQPRSPARAGRGAAGVQAGGVLATELRETAPPGSAGAVRAGAARRVLRGAR